MDGGKEIVLLIRQHIVADGNARRHQLGNAPLHQFLRGFRVFQLVADCHTPSRTYQLRQIRIKSMMRESCHFHRFPLPVGTLGQGDSQYLRSQYLRSGHGIFGISLIEVAAPEEHQRIGMLCLQIEILFHHGGQYHVVIFSHCVVLSLY